MQAVQKYPALFSHIFDEQAIKDRFGVDSALDVQMPEPDMEIAHLFI